MGDLEEVEADPAALRPQDEEEELVAQDLAWTAQVEELVVLRQPWLMLVVLVMYFMVQVFESWSGFTGIKEEAGRTVREYGQKRELPVSAGKL
jgi:hypothetical protein